MARNFAHILFLAYCLILLWSSRQVIWRILSRKMSRKAFLQRQQEPLDRFLYRKLQKAMPPLFFYLNAAATTLVALSGALALLIGWFSFAAIPMKILVFLAVLASCLLAVLCAIVKTMMRFGEPLILYRTVDDPDAKLPFASSVLDGLLFVLVPVVMMVSNFTL